MSMHLFANLLRSVEDFWLRMNFGGPGRSTLAAQSDMLFFWIFAISAFFFVLLMVLMVYFSFIYRKRPGGVPQRSRSHNTFLELTWSVVPTIILVWMFFEGFWGYADISVAPVDGPQLVVTGRKWSWTITYPNGASSPESTHARGSLGPEGEGAPESRAVQETPVFVVPERTPVSLRMSSDDVIHAFWIPDFRVKFDVFPNRFTSMWFEATGIDPAKQRTEKTKGGIEYTYEDHWVFCAEYCGQNHSEMYAVVRVVPRDKYPQIIEEWNTPSGTPVEIGAVLYRRYGCYSCHSVDGSRSIGPTWKDMYGFPQQFTDGSSMTAEQRTQTDFANYVRQSVYEPGAKVVAGFRNEMASYQGTINPRELDALIAYIASLSSKRPPSMVDVIGPGGDDVQGPAPAPGAAQPGTPADVPGTPAPQHPQN